jgi:hypothetical protein
MGYNLVMMSPTQVPVVANWRVAESFWFALRRFSPPFGQTLHEYLAHNTRRSCADAH